MHTTDVTTNKCAQTQVNRTHLCWFICGSLKLEHVDMFFAEHLNFFPFWGGQLTNDKKSGMSPNHVKQFRGPRYLAATSVEVYKKINSCAAILRTTLHRFCRCKLFEVSQAHHFALKGQLMLVLLKLFMLHFWLIKCGEIAVLFFYYSTNIKVTTLCFNSNYVEGKKLMDFSFWCTSVSYSQRPGLFNLALYF